MILSWLGLHQLVPLRPKRNKRIHFQNQRRTKLRLHRHSQRISIHGGLASDPHNSVLCFSYYFFLELNTDLATSMPMNKQTQSIIALSKSFHIPFMALRLCRGFIFLSLRTKIGIPMRLTMKKINAIPIRESRELDACSFIFFIGVQSGMLPTSQ